jgi:hypothetical protein
VARVGLILRVVSVVLVVPVILGPAVLPIQQALQVPADLIRRVALAALRTLVQDRVVLVVLVTLAPAVLPTQQVLQVRVGLTLLVVSAVRQISGQVARVVPAVLIRRVASVARVASVGRQILVPVARVAPVASVGRQALRVRVGLIRRVALAALRTLVQDQAVLLTQQVLQVPAGLIRTWEDQLRNPAL